MSVFIVSVAEPALNMKMVHKAVDDMDEMMSSKKGSDESVAKNPVFGVPAVEEMKISTPAQTKSSRTSKGLLVVGVIVGCIVAAVVMVVAAFKFARRKRAAYVKI
jgi:hypothetical protein